MARTHPRIVVDLGDGWSMAWDTTHRDDALEREMDKAIESSVEALEEIVAGSDADTSEADTPAAA